MFVGAGEDGHAAVLLDAHGHFGADQVETFGAHVPAQKAHAGNADLGLWCARHHGAVGIAHDDVTDAHGGAAVLGALDLRAADRDVVMAAEILLDGGCEPGGHNIELNGSARESPPERDAAENHHGNENA